MGKVRPSAEELLKAIPEGGDKPDATRSSGSSIINDISAALPTYVSGSADLHGSNKNYIKGGGDFGSVPRALMRSLSRALRPPWSRERTRDSQGSQGLELLPVRSPSVASADRV